MGNVTSIKLADTNQRKAVLARKLMELSKMSGQRPELQIEYAADPVDLIRSGMDRDIVVTQLNQQARSIQDVQTALAKIEEGSYGLCEQCEEPISAKRLDAVPWARLCVACQSKAESRTSENAVSFHAAA
jgi:RNA polymerase-binding transcription factor